MKSSLPKPAIIKVATPASQSGQDKEAYFKRPKKRGHPSGAVWKKISDIIEDNIESISPNADFDEIVHTIEDLAKINNIPLNKWALSYLTNRILDLCCCLNYLCQLKISDDSTLLNYCLELTDKEILQLSSFNLCQFKELTKRQQIGFLLSHKSFVHEIIKTVINSK